MIYLIAARRDPMVAPTGVRNLAETGVEFIEDQIVMQTMGREGLPWTPFLLSIFIFVYLCNVPGIIPIIYMPATARMAIPLFLAVIVWLTYNTVGFKHNGISYLTGMLWPRNVPVAMRPLVGLIEFLSNILLRPFSLAVRLFANMLAGHMLLVTFCPVDERLVLRRDEAADPQADVRPAVRHAAVPHRLRGVGRVPAGVHLHDPHRRLHRSRRSPRALTDRPSSPTTSTQEHHHTWNRSPY